jgi:SEC-C motif-containing protein
VGGLSAACPCGSGRPYADCCGRLHGGDVAATAEALMRSRYSAYVLGLEPYLLATWHPSTRPAALNLAEEAGTKWLGLDVRQHHQADDRHAVVEFVARYRVAGRGHRLHEVSRFVREDGRWYYVDGDVD